MSFSGASLFTEDPSSKVLDYYRTHLPNWMIVSNRDGSNHFELKKGGYKRMIAIQEKNDGTYIGVASIGDPASN